MMIPFLTSVPYMVLKTFGLAGLVFFFSSSLLIQIDVNLTDSQFWEQEKLCSREIRALDWVAEEALGFCFSRESSGQRVYVQERCHG